MALTDRYQDCFQAVTASSAAMNSLACTLILLFIFWPVYCWDRFRDMGLLSQRVDIYNCARCCKLPSLVGMPFCIPISLFPYPLPGEYVENIWVFAIMIGEKSYLSIVLICIFLIMNEVEHLLK